MTGPVDRLADREVPHGRGAPPGLKIVVTGPFDAGKTTLIATISEIEVLATERDVSAAAQETEAGHSGRTTVAMDYGRVTLDDAPALHLFGTPGQGRFEFMWDILAEGMLGVVLVVDATRAGTFPDACTQYRHFRAAADVPVVVAANKSPTGADRSATVTTVRDGLDLPTDVQVLVVDARRREDVKQVLLALLHEVQERLAAVDDAGIAPSAVAR